MVYATTYSLSELPAALSFAGTVTVVVCVVVVPAVLSAGVTDADAAACAGPTPSPPAITATAVRIVSATVSAWRIVGEDRLEPPIILVDTRIADKDGRESRPADVLAVEVLSP